MLDFWTRAFALVLILSIGFGIIRIFQMSYYWPSDNDFVILDIINTLIMGFRFDLKVCSLLFLLASPLLIFFIKNKKICTGFILILIFLYILISAVNFFFIGFYKGPISDIIFGLFEDDTKAIITTIWEDFPIVPTIFSILIFTFLIEKIAKKFSNFLYKFIITFKYHSLATFLIIFSLIFFVKGTFRAMALKHQHTTVTTSTFLNNMVLNGPIALYFAFNDRKNTINISEPDKNLRTYGFNSAEEAASQLAIKSENKDDLISSLYSNPVENKKDSQPKNLIFFLMESWSAEPFLYQANNFDVLGEMAIQEKKACHFRNFDSAQIGTHPALEAILFNTPITPLTLGKYGNISMPWSIPNLLKKKGYHTIFATSTQSGWRNLNKSLKHQGFDEVIDSAVIRKKYPEAKEGVWGVWDHYLFEYLEDKVKTAQDKKPFFIFVLTSSNHPPYDLPSDFKAPSRDMNQWKGQKSLKSLEKNLDTYFYATDLLGKFVKNLKTLPIFTNTIIAATGDHNVRSFGMYNTQKKQSLLNQVPFMVWAKDLKCGNQMNEPASHRDMFPSLFPIIGLDSNYFNSGRNLFDIVQLNNNDRFHAVNFTGDIRNKYGTWKLGKPDSFKCNDDKSCKFESNEDVQERARMALLDWHIRYSFYKLTKQ